MYKNFLNSPWPLKREQEFHETIVDYRAVNWICYIQFTVTACVHQICHQLSSILILISSEALFRYFKHKSPLFIVLCLVYDYSAKIIRKFSHTLETIILCCRLKLKKDFSKWCFSTGLQPRSKNLICSLQTTGHRKTDVGVFVVFPETWIKQTYQLK